MKKTELGWGVFLLLWTWMSACSSSKPHSDWKLVWTETFDGQETFDTTVWSKISRGGADWNNYMSDFDSCYAMRDGHLVLRGIVNHTLKQDTAPYLTGGLYTKDKKAFTGGRIEICAKLQGAKGAWPAIWMLPTEGKWPKAGEIDIMERLNHDTLAYQTVHSYYTYTLGYKTEPPHGGIQGIHPDGYNIYSVDIYPDSLVFAINRQHTFTYPRIETDKEGQFPFYQPYYLLIDMQLGGQWVGQVDPKELPVEMWVDWVRYYEKRK